MSANFLRLACGAFRVPPVFRYAQRERSTLNLKINLMAVQYLLS